MLTILEDDTLRAKMSENCRAAAVARYSLKEQALCYIDLYKHAISDHEKGMKGTGR
jgi:hypothetical protein